MGIEAREQLYTIMQMYKGRIPLYIDLKAVEPHVKWILNYPITLDKVLIIVERLYDEADYYTFDSHEMHNQFIEALIDYVLSLIEELYPSVYDQSFYDGLRRNLLSEMHK